MYCDNVPGVFAANSKICLSFSAFVFYYCNVLKTPKMSVRFAKFLSNRFPSLPNLLQNFVI